MKRKNQRHLTYDKEYFVFPLAISWYSRLYYIIKPTSRLVIHFLWWHWHWDFERREGECN